MNDILFGNNNKSTLNLLTKRSLKARKNTIAVLAIMLATLLFTSLFTIAVSLQTAMQESNMRTIGTSAHGGVKHISWDEYESLTQTLKKLAIPSLSETRPGAVSIKHLPRYAMQTRSMPS